MTAHLNLGSLLISLQRLYSQLALRTLKIRSGLGKHKLFRQRPKGIQSPLHEYIDRITENAQGTGKSRGSGASLLKTPTDASLQTSNATDEKSVHTPITDLADYYGSRKVATLLIPEVGKKLKSSAWEHLHEAIRLGHMGDSKNAKLNADLANMALKEAVQYLSRADFEEFLQEIKTKLNDVLTEGDN